LFAAGCGKAVVSLPWLHEVGGAEWAVARDRGGEGRTGGGWTGEENVRRRRTPRRKKGKGVAQLPYRATGCAIVGFLC
jgi:hypothetical protein